MIRKWYFAFNQNMVALYAATIRTAIHSCRKYTDLIPHALYYGERSAFIDEIAEAGVVIPDYTPSYLHVTNWGKYSINPANPIFLRADISSLEQEDDYILFSDIGALFLNSLQELNSIQPEYVAMPSRLEQDNIQVLSSDVMVMNVKAMRETREDFFRYVAACLPSLTTLGADPMASFYQGVSELLPPIFAWKPYWGIETTAKIVHFQRPTPTEAEKALHGVKNDFDIEFTPVVARHVEAYEFYLRKYEEICHDADKRFKRAIMPTGRLINIANNCVHINIKRSNTAIRQLWVDVYANNTLQSRQFFEFGPNQDAIDTVIPLSPTAPLDKETRIDIRFSYSQHSFENSPFIVKPILSIGGDSVKSGPVYMVSLKDDLPLLKEQQEESLPASNVNNHIFIDPPTEITHEIPLTRHEITDYRAPEINCYKMNDALVSMPEGVVFLKNGAIIRETSYFEPIYSSFSIEKVQHWGDQFRFIKEISHGPDIEEPVVLLTTPAAATSYTHFLAYSMPSILLLRKVVERTGAKYLTPELEGWQQDLLNLAGISDNALLEWPHMAVSRAKELYVASSLLKTGVGLHPALGQLFREMSTRAMQTPSEYCTQAHPLVYIKSIDEISLFSNEDEAIARLQDEGFFIVDPLEITVLELIHIVHNARFIIGARTDALVNILFASTGSQVLQIGLRQLHQSQTASFAAIQGLRFIALEATPKEKPGHFSISIDALLHTIEAMFRTRSFTRDMHIKSTAKQ